MEMERQRIYDPEPSDQFGVNRKSPQTFPGPETSPVRWAGLGKRV